MGLPSAVCLVVDDSIEDESEAESRPELCDEWERVRSTSRLVITLNEHAVELGPVARHLVCSLWKLAPGHPAAHKASKAQVEYEAIMLAAVALGEELACDLIRELHPEPPVEARRISGYLHNKAKSPSDRCPRVGGNARLTFDGKRYFPPSLD